LVHRFLEPFDCVVDGRIHALAGLAFELVAVGPARLEDLRLPFLDVLASRLDPLRGLGLRLLLGLGADLVRARASLGEALVGVRFRRRDDLVRLPFSLLDPVEHLWSRHTTNRLKLYKRRIRCLRKCAGVPTDIDGEPPRRDVAAADAAYI